MKLVVKKPGDAAKFLLILSAVEVTVYGASPYLTTALKLTDRGEMYGGRRPEKYAYFPGVIVTGGPQS